MPPTDFAHVTQWVFDLDNTLYPPEARLFDQIEERMTDWVMRVTGAGRAEADRVRHDYWMEYGTTLAGLMAEHDVDPGPYLTEVHDISFEGLTPDPALAQALTALPGRKIIYTNGTAPYAENVVAALGLSGLFEAIYGVEHAAFRPKPDRAAFETVFARDGLTPTKAAMFEDSPRNLEAPRELGMRTIHVAPRPVDGAHIDYHTSNLTEFVTWLGEV